MSPRLLTRCGVFRSAFLFGVAWLLVLCCAAFAEPPREIPTPSPSPSATPVIFSAQTLADLKRLRDAALNSDYAYRELAHLSNSIGPRLSGSTQAAKAVEYVAAELKTLGCDVQLEKVSVPHWVRGEESAALVQFSGQAEGTTQKIILCALGGSVPTPADGIVAEVIAVKNFDEEKVAGKIVLFNYPFDKQMAAEGRGGDAYGEAVEYRSDGPSAAARLGAVACLIRSVGGSEYRIPHTGSTTYAEDAAKIPAGAVTAEDADLIVSLVRQGPVKMRVTLTPQQLSDVESFNVIGDI